ncbi:MAG TPA: PA0069 family radical SAM protein, partial [Candidatus Manganitrophaceae bacterium]
EDEECASSPATRFLPDASRSVIAYNNSPDVGFEASLNPYRGCEHGCAYCYARPTHEYLGFSSGLDFETRIMVKENAPDLLRKELSSPAWKPRPLAMSGVTDPYQPIERKKRLTRKLLEVLLEFRNPVIIITKNSMVARDIDLLAELARFQCAPVFLSITTLDRDLCDLLEPRAARPEKRLETLSILSRSGVQTGVMAAPVIPGLTDAEIPRIIEAAAQAGARYAGVIPLRLPYAVAPLFESWLEASFPGRKDKVLHRIRSIRGGKLNDPRFGSRMAGEGVFAEQIRRLFDLACKKAGLDGRGPTLSTRYFQRPLEPQLPLFENTLGESL